MFRKIRRVGKELIYDTYNACFNPIQGFVLMFHRIGSIEQNQLLAIRDLTVTPDSLQRYIDNKRKNYDFISLDELRNRLISPLSYKRPFICITFDDGFKDNLSIGLPFFENNGIPFSVFITTDFIERHPPFNYPFLIERIVRDNSVLSINGQEMLCDTFSSKNMIYQALKEIVLAIPDFDLEDRFNIMFENYLQQSYYEDNTMTWDDVRQLASSPLCTIGSHTVSHRRLSVLSTSILKREVEDSKRIIENKIQHEVNFISYPYGWKTDVDEGVICAVQDAGYQLGFVSWGGPVRKCDRNPFAIKRQMFHENM